MSRLMLALVLLTAGCKKSPKPTLPEFPGASQFRGGGNVELPEATLFHQVWKSSDHAGQVTNFYAEEMAKRGAKRQGDAFVDDNVVHDGGFGGEGSATVKDPTRPGVYLAVYEDNNQTLIDVWEAVPKAH